MKKKIGKGIILIALMSALFCGCSYNKTTVDVSADGSGKVVSEMGFSKEILEKLGQTPKDYAGKDAEYHETKTSEMTYLTSTYEDAFIDPFTMNLSGVGSYSTAFGNINLTWLDDGFKLDVKLYEDFGPDMEPVHIVPEFENMSDATLQGIDSYDLVAQDVEGLVLDLNFNMPYNVKQTLGGTEGVTVSGKTITLDYVKMTKSGEYNWTFESRSGNKIQLMTDISSDVWYAKAVKNAVDKNLMKGYSDGRFLPNNTLTMAELCKISVSILEANIGKDSGYWAKNFIEYAQAAECVLSDADANKTNWDIPATREQAVYAITKALEIKGETNKSNSVNISDIEKINPEMKDIIVKAYANGIVMGDNEGNFNPKKSITRAEIAQIFLNIE